MTGAGREAREQFILLAEELSTRRGEDPLRNFQLHDKQRAFVRSVLDRQFKENWFIAANRAGKSDAGAYCGATLARFGRQDGGKWDNPGASVQVRDRATSGWVSALDFPTSRDVIQPKYFDNGFGTASGHAPFIPQHEIESWNSEAQILKLKNGSIIGFKSAESGRKKYQGAEKDWFHMDEEHPWEIYEEAVIRVGAKPLIFFCTCTILPPEGINATVSWIFPKLIAPWKTGQLMYVGLFGASIYDNPHIGRDEIKRLEAIYPEGTAMRRIRLEGEWLPGIGGTRAYHTFDRSIHVKEQPPISTRRPLLWIWDFNIDPLISLVGQIDGAVYRIYREFVMDGGNIPEMCKMFRESFPEHGAPIYLYGDATGKRRVGQTSKSDYWTILNEMKQFQCPIEMKVPDENPMVANRVNAVNRLLKDEEGRVRLLIDPSCHELTADLEGVMRSPQQGILKVRNPKDPYYRRTHTSDGLGYMVAVEEPVAPVVARRSAGTRGPIPGPSYGGAAR